MRTAILLSVIILNRTLHTATSIEIPYGMKVFASIAFVIFLAMDIIELVKRNEK